MKVHLIKILFKKSGLVHMLHILNYAKIKSNIRLNHLKAKNRYMETLKYTIIKTEEQYSKYCCIMEELLQKENSVFEDEIELLTLLIEKWDNEHNTFNELKCL